MAKHVSEGRALPLFMVRPAVSARGRFLARRAVVRRRAAGPGDAERVDRARERPDRARDCRGARAVGRPASAGRAHRIAAVSTGAAAGQRRSRVDLRRQRLPIPVRPASGCSRNRPFWFGSLLAVGFLQREFTVYGAVIIVGAELLDCPRFSRPVVRKWLLALVAFLAVREGILALQPHADLLGPGTRGQTCTAGSRARRSAT